MNCGSNNKRIAKNTFFLYIRTIIVMIAMLYTSRVVLKALGPEDLGIYNVVGGIVALMSFFQASLAKATSRFLTFELGRNSGVEQLKRIFSLSMTIHFLLVLFIIFLGETLGLYVLEHWTSIPTGRHMATSIVYQSSLLIFCIHILRVPYDAVIIAHEKMSVYAYMSILEAVMQLSLALILLTIDGDKLILYALLMFIIAVVLFVGYIFYVKTHFKYYRFSLAWNRDYSFKIFSFSSWCLLGSSCNVMVQQGVQLLFNNFVGLIANTALGLANQVNGAVGTFVSNFTTAFNPQIIKLCAQNDYCHLHLLMNRASKFSFVLIWIVSLPILFNIDFVLDLWLGSYPKYTTGFCQMILICSVIDAITGVYNTTITATGKIRNYQICISISFLLDLLCSFFLLKMNVVPMYVFSSRILTRGFLNMIIGCFFVKRGVNFNLYQHIQVVWVPILITVIFSIIGMIILNSFFDDWERLIFSVIYSLLINSLCTFLFIMDKHERSILKNIILNKITYK